MVPSLPQSLEQVLRDAGGEEGILRILTLFYQKMQTDLMLGFFFDGKDLSHIIKQQQSFFLRAAGQKAAYTGMPPGAAHKKIPPILKGHFDRRMVLLGETLREAGLSSASVTAWIGFEEQFRKSIVEEEAPLSERKKR